MTTLQAETFIGYHRLGNSLLHISPRTAVISGIVVSSFYSWRLYEGYTAFKHDRTFPDEPKQLSASWFGIQIATEAIVSTFLFPLVTGMFKYDGGVPIPAESRVPTLTTNLKANIFHTKELFQQQKGARPKESYYSAIKKEFSFLTDSSNDHQTKKPFPWRSLFKFRF